MASAAETALETLSLVERPVRLAAEFVLIVFLALLMARLVWVVASPTEAVATYTDRPLPSPMRGTSSALSIAADRTVLMRSNPFSQADVDAPIIEEAPETTLNLKLIGLRMSTEGGDASNATIRTPNGMAENFTVGDELLAGVTLERILSDRVIINRDGASETLMRGDRGEGLSVITDESRTTPPEAATLRPTTSIDASARPEPSIITAQFSGPDVFFGAVSASEAREGDTVIGYRLSPIGSAEIMRQAGLQPGDIVQSVNGVPLTGEGVADLIDRIAAAETADLIINRDGSIQTVRLLFGE